MGHNHHWKVFTITLAKVKDDIGHNKQSKRQFKPRKCGPANQAWSSIYEHTP